MTYIFDIPYKSRVYKVTNKAGEFLWWSIEGKMFNGSIDFCFTDFLNGKFFDISDSDKAKALTKIAKIK